jgi:hypothetical protein
MEWLTSLGADCCESFICSIFLFDARKMEKSLVWWSIFLPWYIQYRGLIV